LIEYIILQAPKNLKKKQNKKKQQQQQQQQQQQREIYQSWQQR
jgi:hypothetical protein